MAHKKGGGSTRNGRDSEAKRLGVKAFAGQDGDRRLDPRPAARHADSPRRAVGKGGDDTLFAKATGTVTYHSSRGRRFVSIEASAD